MINRIYLGIARRHNQELQEYSISPKKRRIVTGYQKEDRNGKYCDDYDGTRRFYLFS